MKTDGLPSAEDLDAVEMERKLADACYFCFEPGAGQRIVRNGNAVRLRHLCQKHCDMIDRGEMKCQN